MQRNCSHCNKLLTTSYIDWPCSHSTCLDCATPWLVAGIVCCTSCDPPAADLDMGMDPRTACIDRHDVPAPPPPASGPSSWWHHFRFGTSDTADRRDDPQFDPTHVSYHIRTGLAWTELRARGWTPRQIVDAGVPWALLTRSYGWDALKAWGFTGRHLADMGVTPRQLADLGDLEHFKSVDLVRICPTVEALLQCGYTPPMLRTVGFTYTMLRRMGLDSIMPTSGYAEEQWHRAFGLSTADREQVRERQRMVPHLPSILHLSQPPSPPQPPPSSEEVHGAYTAMNQDAFNAIQHYVSEMESPLVNARNVIY